MPCGKCGAVKDEDCLTNQVVKTVVTSIGVVGAAVIAHNAVSAPTDIGESLNQANIVNNLNQDKSYLSIDSFYSQVKFYSDIFTNLPPMLASSLKVGAGVVFGAYVVNRYGPMVSDYFFTEHVKPEDKYFDQDGKFKYQLLSDNKIIADKLVAVTPSLKMRGSDEENNLLNASENGSNMFGGHGLNLFYGKDEKADNFFLSLCSTKLINGTISEIKNFEPGLDKINIFCTKLEVNKEQISIKHIDDHSIIVIAEQNGNDSVIAVAGDVGFDDIILNFKWAQLEDF